MKRSLFAAVALIGVGVVMGVVLITSFSTNAIEDLFASDLELGARQAPVQTPASIAQLNDQFVAVSGAVTRSVVSITVTTESRRPSMQRLPNDFFRFFGPEGEEDLGDLDEGEAGGSGVVITSDGYVVTNNHVVERAKEGGILVTTQDQKEYKARLVGRDSLTDLAVLKIEGSFTPAHFAQREQIRVGEWVVAVGSPLGLKSTVTAGIVSAIGRGIGIIGTNGRMSQRNRYAVENFIQTDAAINPGNSGGGLFNMNGSLVGINTAIASTTGFYNGYGFAIPIDMVKSVALDLIDDGRIQRGYIGVEISSVDEASAKAVGLPSVSGVNVNNVVNGGAAEAAGVEVGDVILEIDGKAVRTSNDLQNEIVLRRAGNTVNLKIWRDGKAITKSVRLKALDGNTDVADRSGRPGDSQSPNSSEPVSFKDLGFTANPLTGDLSTKFDTPEGVYVSKVDRSGAVARRGMRQGTVILKADGKAVSSPAQLQKILGSKKPGEGVLFIMKEQGGSKQAISVIVPES